MKTNAILTAALALCCGVALAQQATPQTSSQQQSSQQQAQSQKQQQSSQYENSIPPAGASTGVNNTTPSTDTNFNKYNPSQSQNTSPSVQTNGVMDNGTIRNTGNLGGAQTGQVYTGTPGEINSTVSGTSNPNAAPETMGEPAPVSPAQNSATQNAAPGQQSQPTNGANNPSNGANAQPANSAQQGTSNPRK